MINGYHEKFRLVIGAVAFFATVAHLAGHEDIEKQIRSITDRLQSDPDKAALYLKRAELHRQHEDWKQALSDFENAEKVDPSLPEVTLGRARVAFDRGHGEASLELVDQLLKQDPSHVSALLLRARCFASLKRPADAKPAYDAFLGRCKTPLPEHYLERAQAVAAAGEPSLPEAVRGLDEGIRQLGDLASLHTRALEFERQSGDRQAALVRVRRFLEVNPGHVRWLFLKGEILAELGRRDEARAACREARLAIRKLPTQRKRSAAMEKILAKINTLEAKIADSK